MITPQHNTHIDLPELLLRVPGGAPGQGLGDAPGEQALADAAHLLEGLDVDEELDAALAGEVAGAGTVAAAQQVVDEEAVEARAAPDLVLDVVDAVHGAELGEVAGAGLLVPLEAVLLPGEGAQLALDAAHARQHRVQAPQHVRLPRPPVHRRRRRLPERVLDVRPLLLDLEVRRPEVLPQELEREAQERFVLSDRRGKCAG